MPAATQVLDASTRRALDALWLQTAGALGFPVERGGDAYVHWDGATLHLSDDQHLDADDSVAQLLLHEICHALTEGPARARQPDWGLDNTSDVDAVRENACLRVQAHLLGGVGLRRVLYPTTIVKDFYFALPRDALAGGDVASVPVARRALLRAAQAPFAGRLGRALDDSAALVGLARHRTGQVLGDEQARCGDCAFRTPGGLCRQAPRRLRVATGERGCARFEATLDCLSCAACCRSAYDAVPVAPRAPLRRHHPDLVETVDGRLRLRREGDHCAALAGEAGGPWRCTVYPDRPTTCRQFAPASQNCLTARRRVGLSL